MDPASKYRIPLEGFLLTLGIALFPIYVFPSGGIQPSHMLFLVFSGIVLFRGGVPNTPVPVLLFIVFLHVFFVEAFYAFGGADPRNLIHAGYYLFNFLLSAAVYLHCRRNGLSSLKYGILVAAAIAVASVVVSGVNLVSIEDTGRNTGAFNNPNQLGFFSVCLLSIFFLLHRLNYMTFPVYIMTLPVPIFLSIVSLSKAAMISNFIVILLAVSPRLSLKSLAFWLAGLVGGVYFVLQKIEAGAFDQLLFFNRLAGMASENDSSLEARGYFAFLDGNFFQVLLGLGAQGVIDKVGNEVHSTLGSMWTAYGVVGFLMLFSVLSIWAFRIWQTHGFVALICICGPAMLYGLTHNGTRFSIFWLLFAASLATTRSRHRVEARSTVSSCHDIPLQRSPPIQ